ISIDYELPKAPTHEDDNNKDSDKDSDKDGDESDNNKDQEEEDSDSDSDDKESDSDIERRSTTKNNKNNNKPTYDLYIIARSPFYSQSGSTVSFNSVSEIQHKIINIQYETGTIDLDPSYGVSIPAGAAVAVVIATKSSEKIHNGKFLLKVLTPTYDTENAVAECVFRTTGSDDETSSSSGNKMHKLGLHEKSGLRGISYVVTGRMGLYKFIRGLLSFVSLVAFVSIFTTGCLGWSIVDGVYMVMEMVGVGKKNPGLNGYEPLLPTSAPGSE
ncbi:hypothetical protein HDU76_010832, partial [Blyttiomyces sp. JEL0837]